MSSARKYRISNGLAVIMLYVPLALGLPIAQSGYHLFTLGPKANIMIIYLIRTKVGRIHVLGAVRLATPECSQNKAQVTGSHLLAAASTNSEVRTPESNQPRPSIEPEGPDWLLLYTRPVQGWALILTYMKPIAEDECLLHLCVAIHPPGLRSN